MDDAEKRAHSVEAERALEHPLVRDVIAEQMANLRLDGSALERYALEKIAHYSATVGRAMALGIDPDELRLTAGEARSEAWRIASELVLRGMQTVVVDEEEDQ